MRKNPYRFGETEIKELLIAWILLAFIFSYRAGFSGATSFYSRFVLILPTLGLGFILHELAHKFAAQRYGFWAEFRISYRNLLIAIMLALFSPIIFAAPGAVMIFPINRYGKVVDRTSNGKISLAGPLANLVIVCSFGFVYLFSSTFPFLRLLSQIGVMVNGFLAFFNLLPFSVLDGAKVFRWNKLIWGSAFLLSLLSMSLL